MGTNVRDLKAAIHQFGSAADAVAYGFQHWRCCASPGQSQESPWDLGCARTERRFFRGLFLNRTHAFKYALSKNGHHPETIVEVSREMEFDVPAHLQIVGTSSAN
ncbi:hypothetical protein [Bradyrhizobium sp. CCBAU 45321]|uniref:hypothetical protein n=1 Tax=Bradyrhizobium sp. CCBAU 45321 TaxID=1641878 RepID=UPI002FE24F4D